MLQTSKPNPAHYALVTLEQKGKLNAIITQNIDMLHQAAGSKVPIYEFHGSSQKGHCVKCKWSFDHAKLLSKMEREEIPQCEKCGGLVKPDVVLFGEEIPRAAARGAERAVQNCDLLIVVGSSLSVAPANFIPMEAKENGARVIFVNRDPTLYDHLADLVIHGSAGEILPQLVEFERSG